jgi:hypothetical protein
MISIQDILAKYGETTVDLIRGNMASAGQNATGDTARAIRSENIGTNRVQVSGPAHVWVLETGRGPYKGGAPANPRLITRLQRWLDAKGLDYDVKGVYYMIQKKGTELYRLGGRTDIITPALSQDRVDQVLKEVADAKLKIYVEQIDESIV